MIPSIEFSAIQITLSTNRKITSKFLFYISYGKGVSKADSFPKTGRKQQLVEQMVILSLIQYLQQITQELN